MIVGIRPITDHGSLSGLGDIADHPYAYLTDGSRVLTGPLVTSGLAIRPVTDSTAAIQIQGTDGKVLQSFDTTYHRVKIGYTDTLPVRQLDVAGNMNFESVSEPTSLGSFAAALAGVGAGSVDNGLHYYAVVFVDANGGETGSYVSTYFPSVTVTDNTTDGKVQLTGIPVSSDPRVVSRKIYRTTAGGNVYTTNYYLATIADNTTTTYLDNTADSGLDTSSYIYRKANTTASMFYFNNGLFLQATDIYHTALGIDALKVNTKGQSIVAIGGQALYANTTGTANTAVGIQALLNNSSGGFNTAIGESAMLGNETGSWNTAVGSYAMRTTIGNSMSYCTAVGRHALYGLQSGDVGNTAIGVYAGRNFGGNRNIFVGYNAGYIASAIDVGDYNIFIGHYVGDNAAAGADNNILIGKELDLQVAAGDDQLSIGNLIFGTGVQGTGTTVSTGLIGIGIAAPSARFHVKGTGATSATYAAKFHNSSDAAILELRNDAAIGFFGVTPIVRPTTGVAEAAFVENSGGTAVNVDSTFGGYTLQQIVQALQSLGLLT